MGSAIASLEKGALGVENAPPVIYESEWIAKKRKPPSRFPRAVKDTG